MKILRHFARMAVGVACAASIAGLAHADEASWRRLMEQSHAAAMQLDFQSAKKSLREAEADALQTYGEGSTQLARTRLALSRVLIDTKDFKDLRDAVPLARSAIDTFSSKLGVESREALGAKKNLAFALMGTEEKPVEAEKLYGELIDTWTRLAGPNSTEVITSLVYLGLAEAKQRRYYDAEVTLAKALAASQQAYGPVSESTARVLEEFGSVIERQGRRGRLAEAASKYRAAVDINRKLKGEKHPSVVEPLDRLAQVTFRLGNRQEGIAMASECVEIRKAELGPAHFRTAESSARLAGLLANSGRYAEAEPLFEESLATLERFYGQRHLLTQSVAATYAEALRQAGKQTEARRIQGVYGIAVVNR
jgi:tetratricopeptide (TPR) repeat protein